MRPAIRKATFLVTGVLDQLSDFLGYWLPAISLAADNGIW
jgi:hypothetical protein